MKVAMRGIKFICLCFFTIWGQLAFSATPEVPFLKAETGPYVVAGEEGFKSYAIQNQLSYRVNQVGWSHVLQSKVTFVSYASEDLILIDDVIVLSLQEGVECNQSQCSTSVVSGAIAGALSGAASGATVGAISGPQTAAAGAVVGATVGAVTGAVNSYNTSSSCNCNTSPSGTSGSGTSSSSGSTSFSGE